MGEYSVKRFTLRYKGLFDFDGLYAAVIDWAKNYGYMWHEIDYKHKVPSPKGAEQEWKWELTLNVTNYIRYTITFILHGWEMMEMDVDVNGKKKSLTSGMLYIWIDGKINSDWQKKFSGKWWPKKLGEWYDKYVFQKEIDSNYGDQLHYRILNLHAVLKTFFDMQTKKYAYKGYLGES